ncbi:hypothetical protein HPP92_000115 [Vanilla planifolia]|uniref:protein-synthesizing GTPase n=1 Tax=Vanilla planifolia TaxID=51239 RepID=A0A835SA22_VANPL|nr:hypothetical protein HPP92_000115 [Vanilla planifolia]
MAEVGLAIVSEDDDGEAFEGVLQCHLEESLDFQGCSLSPMKVSRNKDQDGVKTFVNKIFSKENAFGDDWLCFKVVLDSNPTRGRLTNDHNETQDEYYKTQLDYPITLYGFILLRNFDLKTLNGTIGHVAHGKSTVVKAISGVQTVRFKNEMERNITIKLGYANAKIYKWAYGSGKEDSPFCDVPGFENKRMKLLRHVSFVDCPGHDILMATMLNGAAIMDGALLLIAGNESCPQPQTSEHLAAVEIMRLQHIIILQNKVDLVQESVALNQFEAIQKFIQGTIAEAAPVVPISAQLKYNIDVVCEYIVNRIPIPERNFTSPPNMIVIRSFDVNKPGSEVDEIKGGVAGGSILRGVLKVDQLIEVRPGIVMKDENGNIKCTPIYSRIVSLYAEQNELQFAVPGGLIGVGTTMDPTLTRADRLVGQVLGEVNSLPDVFVELEVNFFLLRRLLGVRTKGAEKQGKVSKLAKAEMLMLNIGSMSTGARVVAVRNDLAKLQLTAPVCTSRGEKVALSRRVEKHWRLIGWGQIQAGATLQVPEHPNHLLPQ